MGCGKSVRANVHVPVEKPPHLSGRSNSQDNATKQKHEPEVRPSDVRKLEKLPGEEKKEVEDVGSIAIQPSQFIIEKKESIYHNYSLREKLGEGSFGIVYKAIHKVSQEKRAIKFIDRSAVSAKEEAKLMQEISILRQLDHPHIVKLYEFYSDAKYYYMVTELVEGGELFDEIQRKKTFSEQMGAEIISQLLSAIVYCHERKIVHRDLKPENILLDTSTPDKLQIKVIDFGTAQFFDPSVKLRSTTGTAYYIAPEVLLKNYDEKCDVWSCGVILYILLSGTPPFNGKDDEEIIRAVKKTKYSFYSSIWEDISPPAKELIIKMLKYPSVKRISAKEAYAHEWIKSKKFNELKAETAQCLLTNLKNFHTEQKLQQAALMYIVTQLMTKKEKDKLQQTFMALDTNADGKLSQEELIQGYTTLYGNAERANKEVAGIMQNVDSDHNGFIDYSEFLIASTNKQKLLSKENLKRAFQLFDKDGSGFISADEVKTILGLGKRFSEQVWTRVIGEVDQNSDGQISFEEFEKMMSKFLAE